MKVEWKKEYAIGVHEIDSQHQELFGRLNALLEGVERGRGDKELLETLSFLDDYTKRHFAAEESLQRRFEYPHYEMHVAEHRHFLQTLATLHEKIAASGPTEQNVKLVCNSLENWLISHLCTIDRPLGEFINRNRNLEWEKWLRSQF